MVSVVMMMMMLVEVDDVGGCVGDYCYGDDECGCCFVCVLLPEGCLLLCVAS